MRDDLFKYLSKNGIMSKIYFEPIHLTPFYKKSFNTKHGALPITERVSEQILTLPMFASMNNEEKTYVVEKITEFFENYRSESNI